VISLFPMFLKLEGKRCLVVGAGKVGEPKICTLLGTGADIHVVSLEATKATHELAEEGKVRLSLRVFAPSDLDGIFLVIVATSSRELNDSIYREAQQRGALCNVVDDPPRCNFFYPAVVRRGALQIAVSTSGQSPSLAKKLRQQLEQQFGPGYARWVEELGATRRRVLASHLSPERKRELLRSLASQEAFESALAGEANAQAGEIT
jgi:siroheme synthase-like protein